MDPVVTIIVTPRDRYSGLDECIDSVYRHTQEPFRLRILDLDYPASTIDPVRKRLLGRTAARFFELGMRTALDALREAQPLNTDERPAAQRAGRPCRSWCWPWH